MRILVINKYVPPEPAPTAALIGDLAMILRAKGAEVTHLGAEEGYRDNRPQGWRRWLHEIQLLLRLFWTGLTSKRPDCILCLSDPPGILFVAAILAKLKGTRLVHWAMDVYPDTAVALGEVRPGGLVHRLASSAMSFSYRSCQLIACLDCDMLEYLRMKDDPRAFISSPWPPLHIAFSEGSVAPRGERIQWMYSGNLGRAHEYETLLRAQKLLEDAGHPFELVFQGGGNAWTAARQLASDLGLQQCRWENYAPSDNLVPSLLQAHVLIATQRQEVRGLLWPSKLALLKLLPRPLVWVGPHEGAISTDLRNHSALNGVFAVGDFHALADWLALRINDFAKEAEVPFSPATLKPACLGIAHAEGEKWWSHLVQLLLPDSPDGAPLKATFSEEPA
ncbi:glycosyltransferase involved in cell wall biosynthesis [Roseimicrobium gellanilyticum]|uniref:Glycosyltransferase involved in cell wall biosynthesis n=1 Tax=Roseimicrobium gellanilyticum TaxID=748857 RepID=A0A366HPP4_9BACT|nr:hypothetical protein [Roseimicrobium gellanilyticum]RBP45331.1 glycosyltransferase involved in cell wall biosynthesis [Roseimicrobium gellanilyticum]